MTDVSLVEELKTDYLRYALSTITGRAIPDYRDGLKPIHRRILVAGKWLNLKDKFLKSARLEGEVMGKLHPHGASYSAMVTLTQPWSSLCPLMYGQGNFGTPSDEPAASRYTEIKVSNFGWDILLQENETWENKETYDGQNVEPIFLNAKFPVILTQITNGIAVGYATNTISHNMRDIAAGKKLYPDSPTGCEIVKDSGLEDYVSTGKGKIKMRALYSESTYTDPNKKRNKTTPCLTFTNFPIQTTTERIATEIKDGLEKSKIYGITGVFDQTDLKGERLTVVLDKKSKVQDILSILWKYTSLEYTYNAKLLVLYEGIPKVFAPNKLLDEWKSWRENQFVIYCSFKKRFFQDKIQDKEALMAVHNNLDKTIKIIRSSDNPKEELKKFLGLNEEQIKTILDMRLSQLQKLERERILQDLNYYNDEIKKLEEREKNPASEINNQLLEIAKKYGSPRKSKLVKEKEEKEPLYSFDIDEKNGRIKSPGKNVIDKEEKVIIVLEDGKAYKKKVSSIGPISNSRQKVLYWFLEKNKSEEKICCYSQDGRKNNLSLNEISKCTSKGSLIMPDLERIGGYDDSAPEMNKGSKGTF